MGFLLSASILSADFSNLSDQIRQAESAGVDWIHVDVMDGHFVPNITMGSFIVEACRRITTLPLDVHLMIEQPERHIEAFAAAGANFITIHVESNPNLHRTLGEISRLGCKSGIVLNPGTPPIAVREALPIVELVLVMTVNPGYSGQSFIPDSLRKIREISLELTAQGSSALIEVDGGITADTLPGAYQAGARVFVAATSIFKHPGGIGEGIGSLRNAIRD